MTEMAHEAAAASSDSRLPRELLYQQFPLLVLRLDKILSVAGAYIRNRNFSSMTLLTITIASTQILK